jgi:uncharacterized protein YceK
MRHIALLFVLLVLGGCGSQQSQSRPTPDQTFAAIAGIWQCTVTSANGAYASNPVGTIITVTVTDYGVAMFSTGGPNMQLWPEPGSVFQGTRVIAPGQTEYVSADTFNRTVVVELIQLGYGGIGQMRLTMARPAG